MVDASLYRTYIVANYILFLSFSVKHSFCVYNWLPNKQSGLNPLKNFTRSESGHRGTLHCHVWGCPVFVLELNLQNYQKVPKWNRRACLGQFLGFSGEHSSLVANVRHLGTGYISTQFHLIFGDLFQTGFSREIMIVQMKWSAVMF